MIKEVELIPYPRMMWIAKNENFDNLKEVFEFISEEDLSLTNEKIVKTWNAIVFEVNKDNRTGYLVFICSNYEDSNLVHEAVHVALNVYEDCSMELNSGMDQEPLAYLIEYVYKKLAEL